MHNSPPERGSGSPRGEPAGGGGRPLGDRRARAPRRLARRFRRAPRRGGVLRRSRPGHGPRRRRRHGGVRGAPSRRWPPVRRPGAGWSSMLSSRAPWGCCWCGSAATPRASSPAAPRRSRRAPARGRSTAAPPPGAGPSTASPGAVRGRRDRARGRRRHRGRGLLPSIHRLDAVVTGATGARSRPSSPIRGWLRCGRCSRPRARGARPAAAGPRGGGAPRARRVDRLIEPIGDPAGG